MSYGGNNAEQSGSHIDKILKVASPATGPSSSPRRSSSSSNLKTADAIGLTIPQQSLL